MDFIPKKYEDKPTLIMEDVMEILNVSRSKAYALAKDEMFPVKKLGHTVRIPTIQFFAWLNNLEQIGC